MKRYTACGYLVRVRDREGAFVRGEPAWRGGWYPTEPELAKNNGEPLLAGEANRSVAFG